MAKTVTAAHIKAVFKAAGISAALNCYRDEPTKGYHYASVESGKGDAAIEALTAAGLTAFWVPACSHIYGDNVQISREGA